MTQQFNAHFQNGVLVPDEPVDLPERTRLRVVVDELPAASPPHQDFPRYDDPADPMPQGGVELVDWWRRHRIPVDPGLSDRIARSKEYVIGGGEEDDA